MKRHHGLFVLMALGLAILLAGCWGSDKSTSVDLTTAQPTNVGDTICEQCHSATIDPQTQESIVFQYERSSPHKEANNGNGCEACHGGGSLHYGQGPIPYPNPYDNNGARCADCHNGTDAPLTDAPTKFATSNHREPQFTQEEGDPCRRCHSHENAVPANLAGWTGSKDIMTNPVNAGLVPLTLTYTELRCSTCHEHGAGLRLVMARDNNSNLVNWNPDGNDIPGQFDLCTSCHTMYDYTGTTLLASGTAADAATGKPATGMVGYHETSWYRIIATTHFDNPATGKNAADNEALPAGNIIEGYNLRMGGEEPDPCFDCHGHEAKTFTRRAGDPLEARRSIHTDWAQSGHAGGLLKAKYDAAAAFGSTSTNQVDSVMISGVAATDNTSVFGSLTRVTHAGDAWTHYQWEKTLKADGTSDRGTCQRCHTATGASNYLNNPAAYNYRNNDFSHLSGWKAANLTATPPTATVPSPQQEVLYCWGCHTSPNKGVLRAPGPITAEYSGVSPEPVYPDVAGSNVCLACHTGRESGDSIKAKTSGFDNLSFINSHYLTAGGTVFAVTGYEYAGRDYEMVRVLAHDQGDKHDQIGTGVATGDPGFDAVRQNYVNGPCVSCHLDSRDPNDVNVKRSHSFRPFTQYSPTDNLALNPVCVNCHTTRGAGSNSFLTWFGDEATGETFQGTTHRARYQAGLEALRVLLEAKGYFFEETHPYFFMSPDNTASANAVKNWLSPGDADTTGNTTGKNNMGAAFNYNLMKHDPGGVAHNRRYTRRLIYDAIDWADDDILNYSVAATLTALDDATVYKASAIAYILRDNDSVTPGNQFSGTALDRY